MLVFLIGLRFVTPYSTNATVVQRTIQLIPRLPEPTLVTDVLVEEGAPVKRASRYSSSTAARTNTKLTRFKPNSPRQSKTSAC
jgi:hypothetical protein